MQLEKLQSGLVVPQQKKKPEPPRGPLEFSDQKVREKVYLSLQSVYDHCYGRYLCKAETDKVQEARRDLLRFVANALTGNGDFEERC